MENGSMVTLNFNVTGKLLSSIAILMTAIITVSLKFKKNQLDSSQDVLTKTEPKFTKEILFVLTYQGLTSGSKTTDIQIRKLYGAKTDSCFLVLIYPFISEVELM